MYYVIKIQINSSVIVTVIIVYFQLHFELINNLFIFISKYNNIIIVN